MVYYSRGYRVSTPLYTRVVTGRIDTKTELDIQVHTVNHTSTHTQIRRSRDSGAARQDALHAMTDEDLMSNFQAGSIEAFNILVDRYSERLTHYLYGFLGDMKRCEVLLQETFLCVYRNRHSYRRIAKFSRSEEHTSELQSRGH